MRYDERDLAMNKQTFSALPAASVGYSQSARSFPFQSSHSCHEAVSLPGAQLCHLLTQRIRRRAADLVRKRWEGDRVAEALEVWCEGYMSPHYHLITISLRPHRV